MNVKRLAAIVLFVLALTPALAAPALAAVKLPINTAGEKAFVFAKHTCAHDHSCVRYGVTNCRRQSLHVVICRIFDERSTSAQGKYDCQRLVRVALNPVNYRIQVTGQSSWAC